MGVLTVSRWEGRGGSMDNSGQLSKDVGKRLGGGVGVTSFSQFDNRQTDRPDIRRSSVARCLTCRFSLYTLGLFVSVSPMEKP